MNWEIGKHYGELIINASGQCPYCYNVRDFNIRMGGKCVNIQPSHCRQGSYLIYFEMDKDIPACPYCDKKGRFYYHEIDSLDTEEHAMKKFSWSNLF